jgi:uncharacterized RDD family membrane protein YckC
MDSPDELLNVDTPENVIFDYKVAGIGSRFLAALLDTLIITALQVLVILVAMLLVSIFVPLTAENLFSSWMLAIAGLISFLFYWGYYIFFELTWNGQSPGKRKAGLRVIRIDGMPITPYESIIRNLVRVIDLLPYAYGVGVIVMFIDKNSRRLGDLAAGTVVVYDRQEVTLQTIYHDNPTDHLLASTLPGERPDWPVERLGQDDIRLAEDFLRRKFEIANGDKIAAQIAARLARKMEIELRIEERENPLHYVASVVDAYRQRNRPGR